MTSAEAKQEEIEIEIEGDDVPAGARKITWFKASAAPELLASGIMTPTVLSPEVIGLITASKLHFGNAARVLYQDEKPDGFSIVHAWFGENFPLPSHKHAGDCIYLVLSGSLRMGAKTIEAGDGLFVPNGRPYSYRAGPGGVEVIEFRTVSTFDMQTLDTDVDKWKRFVAIGEEMSQTWQDSQPQWVRDLPAQGVGVVSE